MAEQLPQQMAGLSVSGGPLPPSTTHATTVQGTASIFTLNIQKGATVYRYDVDITRMDLNKVITRGGADDGQKSLYRRLCHEILLTVHNRTQAFGGGQDLKYVYDCRKNLFTNKPVQMQRSAQELKAPELTPFVRKFLKESDVRVDITPSQQPHIDISDIKKALMPDMAGTQADRSIRMFLELLTTQPNINNGEYDVVGVGKVFETKRQQDFGDGLVMRTGLSKGVRIIDNNKNPTPALVADVKKCAFFAEQTLDKALASFAGRAGIQGVTHKDLERFIHLFRGVRCYLTYAPSRSVVISDLTRESIKGLNIKMKDGKTTPLAAYYMDKYKVKVNNANWPAIKIDTNNDAAFPWEVLMVLPNQRIPVEKMNERLSSELLRLNTVLPHERHRNLMAQLQLVLSPDCQAFMRAFGVTIDLNSNNITVKMRTAPQLQYGDRTIPATGGNWGRDAGRLRYNVPSQKLTKWAIVYDQSLNPQETQKFAQNFVRLAGNKGMRVPQPQLVPLQGGIDGLDAIMKKLKADQNNMIMLIDEKFQKSHGMLKLLETRHGLLTQHVTAKNAFQGGAATQTNIMNKFNCKVFGLNYKPIIENVASRLDITKNIMVIGFDVITAPKASPHTLYKMGEKGIQLDSCEPSIVGFSANYGDDAHKFLGDYFFMPCRGQQIDSEMLKQKMIWILQQYEKNHQPKTSGPGLIIVMRDGLSEGQFPMSINEELPVLRQACQEFRPSYNPKFVYIISTKRHNKRFYGKDQRGIANLQPGSVIDEKIVRADCPEFFMQSHLPIKGTAKVPQYAVPVNDAGLRMDELQAFVNMLCHTHQIVNLAISTPEPVYQASELAKRGSNNYAEMCHKFRQMIPKNEDGMTVNCQRLTQMLGYGANHLATTRFTA